jgi:oligopeptide transport system permease protein
MPSVTVAPTIRMPKSAARFVVTGMSELRRMCTVTTNLAADFGILIVGATVTEGIFNVPGVGAELFKAINRHDTPEIVSIVTVLVIVYVLVNLAIDLLYGVLDPRIRYVK